VRARLDGDSVGARDPRKHHAPLEAQVSSEPLAAKDSRNADARR
jgi:hypothetical protein